MQFVLIEPAEGRCSPVLESVLSALGTGLQARTVTIGEAAEAEGTLVIGGLYAPEDQEKLSVLPQVRTGRFLLVDHAWFGDEGVRGNRFRIVSRGMQPGSVEGLEPDWDRYRALGLDPVLPWRRRSGDVLVLPQSDSYGMLVGMRPEDFLEWVVESLPAREAIPGKIVVRARFAAGPRLTPEEALDRAAVVIGYNTEMMLRALRLGVPAISYPGSSVVWSFNGLGPQDIGSPRLYDRSVEEREHLMACLATFYQASLEELAAKGFVERLVFEQERRRQRPWPSPKPLEAVAAGMPSAGM